MLCPIHKTPMIELFTSFACDICDGKRAAAVKLKRTFDFTQTRLMLANGSIFADTTLTSSDFGLEVPGRIMLWQSNRCSDPTVYRQYLQVSDLVIYLDTITCTLIKSRYSPAGSDIVLEDGVYDFLLENATSQGTAMMVIA